MSGSLVVSNTLRARFQPKFSFTFPAAGFSVTDIGNGVLQLHATGVTMVKGLVFQGATGTFTLEINGTIKKVMHN